MVTNNTNTNTNNNNEYTEEEVKKEEEETTKPTITTTISKNFLSNLPVYTLKRTNRKNGKPTTIEIIEDIKFHNFWNNIFERKFNMHEYFSEAAFGSQSDTKVELREVWKDPEFIKKYMAIYDIDEDVSNESK
jgi:hypothetical protein